MVATDDPLETAVLRPVLKPSWRWYAWTGLLLALVAGGLAAYAFQVREGLWVTGMRDTVSWGVYISNFVFFSGVSMAGTFMSAMLRITGAEWRKPLTRLAEVTTVAALSMCALMPVVDIGRPDRLFNILRYGRLESPLLWDILVITTYLTASILYLYLFLIPDAAMLRDRLRGKVSGMRQRAYELLALGWRGAPEQHARLERGATIMMLIAIPIGVGTHSVVSWIFGMTYRAGWDSTIFAPYFAVGALYSGTAMLITLMFIFRRALHLKAHFTEKHFRYMAYMMLAFGIIYFYFTFAEYLTVTYKMEESEKPLLEALFFGQYAAVVWPGFVLGQVAPILAVALPWTRRSINALFIASLLVNVGMWIKRYMIVVPSLANPLMPYKWGVYNPTFIEGAIALGSFAGFALIITVFTRLFPIVSLWEMREVAPAPETARSRQASPGAVPAPTLGTSESGGTGDA